MTALKTPELVLKNAKYCNVFTEELLEGDIAVDGGRFVGIGEARGAREVDLDGAIVVPAFLDGHIHLESTMTVPSEFARVACLHGTAAVVADPHEIANVCGAAGIDFMLQSTRGLPVDCFFMLPSCVPAAPGEENGAVLDAESLRPYYGDPRILGLGEVMDLPSVLNGDSGLSQKLADARRLGKHIDGHAPGLAGGPLDAYLCAGITTDHECTTLEEALEKLRRGMWILLREGTAARNLDALLPLLQTEGAGRCLFVTDDRHPDELMAEGHIDGMVRRAIRAGIPSLRAIRTASRNAAECFGLRGYGAVAPGYRANFIVTDDLDTLAIRSVWHNGRPVFPAPSAASPPVPAFGRVCDTFHCRALTEADFSCFPPFPCEAVQLLPGQILTRRRVIRDEAGCVRLAVVERHKNTGHIGRAYLCGYGLRRGAIASSIAHDSHNLIVAGTNPRDMAVAAEAVRTAGGGLAAAADGALAGLLPLPVGGLMSPMKIEALAADLRRLREAVSALGEFHGVDPFMTLSFVSLPVLPEIRLTSRGIVCP